MRVAVLTLQVQHQSIRQFREKCCSVQFRHHPGGAPCKSIWFSLTKIYAFHLNDSILPVLRYLRCWQSDSNEKPGEACLFHTQNHFATDKYASKGKFLDGRPYNSQEVEMQVPI